MTDITPETKVVVYSGPYCPLITDSWRSIASRPVKDGWPSLDDVAESLSNSGSAVCNGHFVHTASNVFENKNLFSHYYGSFMIAANAEIGTVTELKYDRN